MARRREPERGPGRQSARHQGRTEDALPGRLRTALALVAVDLGLRLLGFARVRALLGRPGPAGEGVRGGAEAAGLSGAERALAESLARRVERAAGFRVYRVPCLPRALLLQRWLTTRGLPAELRIGARREGGVFGAHAWVECGTTVLDPDPAVDERFPPLRG